MNPTAVPLAGDTLPPATPALPKFGIYALLVALAFCALAPGLSTSGNPVVLQALVVVGFLGAALSVFMWYHRGDAAMVAGLPLLPPLAAIGAVGTFVVWRPQDGVLAPLAGLTLAIVAWRLLAFLCRDYIGAQYCNPSSYGELRPRLEQVKVVLERFATLANSPQPPPAEELKWAEVAKNEYIEILQDFASADARVPWVLATGYITEWKRLHRAEEALIEIVPVECAIAGALEDELRLIGSSVNSRDELLAKLRRAVVTLQPSALSLLKLTSEEARAFAPPPGNPPPAAAVADQKTARSILRIVRKTLNQYEDDRYYGLVAIRNNTWITSILTGIVGFLLLATPMIATLAYPATGERQDIKQCIVAGAVYFLVGATVGLLARLRAELSEDKDVADYGLSNARLYASPMISGLAAVFGVVLVGVFPNLINDLSSDLTGGAASAAAGASANDTAVPGIVSSFPLQHVFDLGRNIKALFLAALFGMTPELLFARLQQAQTKKAKAEIKAVDTTQGARAG
ncbi:hypothetical protein DB347_07470 [Opitutaceae bacterium EW11]|nr:hypothetical protein DB347_07470 [Opitutaceae bacterium EW11]